MTLWQEQQIKFVEVDMDDRRYNVVFKGEIHEQATLSLVQERLATLFKADIESIKIMFSKKRTIVKKNATYETCQRVEQGFLNAGAFVDIEEVPSATYPSENQAPAPGQDYTQEQQYAQGYEQEQGYSSDQGYAQEQGYEFQEEYSQEQDYAQEPEPYYAEDEDPNYPYQPEYTAEPEPETEQEEESEITREALPVSESEPQYVFEQDAEEDDTKKIVIDPEPPYEPDQDGEPEPEPASQYVFEQDAEDTQEPDDIDPDPDIDFGTEYDFDSALKPPDLEDSLEEDDPEEDIQEPAMGYGPPPGYKPDQKAEPLEVEEKPEKAEKKSKGKIDEPLLKETPSKEEEEEESQIDLESDSEFEILEDESEFEILGVEPDPEPEFDLDSDLGSDYDFEDEGIEPEEPEEEIPEEKIEVNPYAAPSADLSQPVPMDKNFVYPQRRPFKNGVVWLKNGFALFKESKIKWIISVFLFMFISTITGLIPFVGTILSNIFNPVFLAGFIIGAKEQDEGKGLRIGHVFSGFSNNFGQLILFGLLYFVTILLVFGLIAVVFLLLILAGGLGSMNFSDPSTLSPFASMSPSLIILIILSGMFITVPIMMAYYFGPALISVNKVSIFEAVKLSFRGCLRNMLPFILYGIACFGVFIAAIAVIGGVGFSISLLHKEAGIVTGFLLFLIMSFTIMPIFIASTYSAYKDIFYNN